MSHRPPVARPEFPGIPARRNTIFQRRSMVTYCHEIWIFVVALLAAAYISLLSLVSRLGEFIRELRERAIDNQVIKQALAGDSAEPDVMNHKIFGR